MTKVHFETFGCVVNIADSEQMKGLLTEAEFEIIDNAEEADIIIINSCTIKGPIESKIIKRLEELKGGYKIIILAGCIAQSEPNRFKEYPLIGTKQTHNVVEIVEEALNNNVISAINLIELPPLDSPLIRKNPTIEIIPINRGCLGFCTFCKTKSARGKSQSYPIDQIINRARKGVKEGVKEIWLTSQDSACYGFDIKTNLPTLLNELVKIPGDYKIRVGMMNPDHLLKIQNELIESFKHDKIFKFLHLPIQSGNNKILKEMKRQYKVQDFEDQIDLFRIAIPKISIMTDIIVGFPGETVKEFSDTINCLRKISPDYTNVSKFWARPKTPAEKMKNQIDDAEIKRRSRITKEISQNISQLRHEIWFGWEGNIILTKKGDEENEWIGYTSNYNPVELKGDYQLGQKIRVKIVKTRIFSLKGEEI